MKPKDLNPSQKEAVVHGDGPLLIIAGAGSGKTHTLTSRLLHLVDRGVSPTHIIAITFTNKAAKEMRDRVIRYAGNNPEGGTELKPALFIGTFHSLGVRILKEEAATCGRTALFSIFDEDDSLSLLRSVMKSLNLSKEKYNPLKIRARISRIKNELADPGDTMSLAELRIFEDYETALAENNAFDFDDLLEKTVRLFQKYPKALAKYRGRFRHILVDEFQDINTCQYEFIKLLALEHKNLNVVGDDSQAIYGFRGSDFRNFLNFEKDWPQTKIVKLEQNYRSTSTIIKAASAVIKNNIFQKPKELWTENPDGETIRIVKNEDGETEAVWIANEIAKLRKSGVSGNESVVILYRTNAQSRALEQALIMNEIPYRIFGGLRFYERKEIKDVLAGLRLVLNPKDSVSRERLIKTFGKGLGKETFQVLLGLSADQPILQSINTFLETTDYFSYLDRKFQNPEERIENVNELIVFAGTFTVLSEFLERVALVQSQDTPGSASSQETHGPVPELMTIHLAKGLEFNRVFVAGVEEGILPHQRSYSTREGLEEERRLMYVAMTRARNQLSLSFSKIPSRFLYELPPELVDFKDETGHYQSLPDEDELYLD